MASYTGLINIFIIIDYFKEKVVPIKIYSQNNGYTIPSYYLLTLQHPSLKIKSQKLIPSVGKLFNENKGWVAVSHGTYCRKIY